MMKLSLKTLVFFVFLSNQLLAQEAAEKEKWDVNKPVESFKNVSIETEEGTWMNLDVSPDGKTIVFDMLGDIYSLPIEGGEATLLREGHAFEIQPRFSPDGSRI